MARAGMDPTAFPLWVALSVLWNIAPLPLRSIVGKRSARRRSPQCTAAYRQPFVAALADAKLYERAVAGSFE